MTALVLMYVYYDVNGDIKAITPAPTDSLGSEFTSTSLPLADVEMFLTGRQNPFDYSIKKVTRVGRESCKLVRKERNVSYTRTLDTYLTKVENQEHDDPILKITSYPDERRILLELNPMYKALYTTGTEEEQEDINTFVGRGPSTLYFTAHNNPYTLLFSITFLPRDLFDEGQLEYTHDETIDLSNSSVYTRKILNGYGYKIRKKKNVV